MAKNRKNFYQYSPEESERLRRVTLPAKIKCDMCSRNYNQANFSQNQLDNARSQVQRLGSIRKNPRCTKCTGGQLVEIECVMCHKTKGLEAFAKVQRRRPDDATCFDCIQIQVERAPVDEVRYEDPNKAFITTDTSDSNHPDYFTSASSSRGATSSAGDWEETASDNGSRRRQEGGGIDLSEHFQHTMSINGSISHTLIDSEFSYPPTNEARPKTFSEAAGTGSWHTGSATAPSTRSGFDSNRYSSSTATSVAGSQHSFNSNVVERSQFGSEPIEMRNGFAKVKAYKPEKQEDPFSDDEEEEDSDNDDDNDGEDTVI